MVIISPETKLFLVFIMVFFLGVVWCLVAISVAETEYGVLIVGFTVPLIYFVIVLAMGLTARIYRSAVQAVVTRREEGGEK